jgi:hypothetical protein
MDEEIKLKASVSMIDAIKATSQGSRQYFDD